MDFWSGGSTLMAHNVIGLVPVAYKSTSTHANSENAQVLKEESINRQCDTLKIANHCSQLSKIYRDNVDQPSAIGQLADDRRVGG